MVMKFVGGFVLVINGILVIFLSYKSYGAGVFHSCSDPYSCKAVKRKYKRFLVLFFYLEIEKLTLYPSSSFSLTTVSINATAMSSPNMV